MFLIKILDILSYVDSEFEIICNNVDVIDDYYCGGDKINNEVVDVVEGNVVDVEDVGDVVEENNEAIVVEENIVEESNEIDEDLCNSYFESHNNNGKLCCEVDKVKNKSKEKQISGFMAIAAVLVLFGIAVGTRK